MILFFLPCSDDYTLQISPESGTYNENHLDYFRFIGRICGMAVYHNRLIDGEEGEREGGRGERERERKGGREGEREREVKTHIFPSLLQHFSFVHSTR